MKNQKLLIIIIYLFFTTTAFSQTLDNILKFKIPITSEDSLFKKDGVLIAPEILNILNSCYINYVKGEKFTNESRQFSKVYLLAKNESNLNCNFLLLKYPYNLSEYTCYLLCVSKDYKSLMSLIEIIIHGGPEGKSFIFNNDSSITVRKESEQTGTKLNYIIRQDGYFELTSFEKYKVF